MQRLRSLVYGCVGQTTSEYALVLLVAGLVVGVFAAFVRSGALDDMFSQIVDGLTSNVEGK